MSKPNKLTFNVDAAGRGRVYLDGRPIYPTEIAVLAGVDQATRVSITLTNIEIEGTAEVLGEKLFKAMQQTRAV